MEEPVSFDDIESHEPDLPPEVEVFASARTPAKGTDFFSDVTQLYLNEIGANPLLTDRKSVV